ncbi:hypothetical protein CDAR_296401 [Caerostris darwini]|uniref:Uncharacterized protein n=1 Tax=Caerostris darwini TaxID=1538125 RepID=A0AAV4PIX9_9ARAC|nr:hypothetical protein CDAR_296401 [Caerostris darwini]
MYIYIYDIEYKRSFLITSRQSTFSNRSQRSFSSHRLPQQHYSSTDHLFHALLQKTFPPGQFISAAKAITWSLAFPVGGGFQKEALKPYQRHPLYVPITQHVCNINHGEPFIACRAVPSNKLSILSPAPKQNFWNYKNLIPPAKLHHGKVSALISDILLAAQGHEKSLPGIMEWDDCLGQSRVMIVLPLGHWGVYVLITFPSCEPHIEWFI